MNLEKLNQLKTGYEGISYKSLREIYFEPPTCRLRAGCATCLRQ